MANTGSQAEAIRELLVERMELFDPTVDTAEGAEFWSTVVDPVFQALGVDPFDVDVETFLLTRLRQEYPTVAANAGDAIVDLLVRPNQVLLEPWKREVQIVRRGQSVKNVATMRDEDADALAANWFVTRRDGKKVSGVVRVYYAAPTYVAVTSTITFSTSSGLKFLPTVPQFFRAETMLLQKSGTYYYIDVSVIAENPGSAYEIDSGQLTQVAGLTGATRATNIFAFRNGLDRETNLELLTRTQKSLTERSLNTRRGIYARLMGQFAGIRNLEVVGYGDPEMARDVVEGTGEGHVKATGTCFIVGQFCLMFSQYEDRGSDGTTAIDEGDIVNLNYWNLLYDLPDSEQHEEFSVDDILFDSRDIITNLPGILLFRLSGAPAVAKSVLGMLPGTLPAVFCVVKGSGKITISSMPGGILDPDTNKGTVEIDDAAIHIGGHYDVWLRPTSDTEQTATITTLKSTSVVVEGTSLVTNGQDTANKNRVYNVYQVTYTDRDSTETVSLGQTVTGSTSGATATVVDHATSSNGRGQIELSIVSGLLEDGEEIVVTTGATVTATLTVSSVTPTLHAAGALPGMLLAIVSGTDLGVYRIVATDDSYVYLDTDLTVSETDVHFRVVSEIVIDAFAPKENLIPFGAATGDDLISVIGSERVRVGVDLLLYGVAVGDTLEILDGEDQGSYTIASFDETLGASAPLLSAAMTASNSEVSYKVYRQQTGLQPPLVRIKPGGVKLLDPSGQDSGYVIPYALPIDGRAKGAFSGASQTIAGKNGFVLPDPGNAWEPTASVPCVDDLTLDTRTCYSDECLECDGYIACVTLMADGTFYINSGLPVAAKNFFNDLKSWILNVINTFELGDGALAFVQGLSPFTLGAPLDAIDFTGGAGVFTVGEAITGGTSGATGVVDAITIRLTLNTVSGPFTDGETVTGGTSGATAVITIVSDTEIELGTLVGVFLTGETITGGTSAQTAIIDDCTGTITVSTVVGTFQDTETITGATSGATSVIEVVVVPILQFEICIPAELFDGCNNVFVAMPEFDWEATLGSAESLVDAISLYTAGDLNGSAPALASAAAGDALTVLAGANAGSYIINKVYSYRLCSAGAIVSSTVDLSKCYQVVAVVIDGEFPVPAIGGLADFFATGVPDLSTLPSPPAFPGTSYDDDGNAQSPWDWVALFLDWLLKFLVSMGFDLPESIELNAQETLKSLWQMLFTEYVVGKTTCEQYTRVYFIEPTSVTMYGPRPCAPYKYALPVTAGVVLTGAEITVPMADLSGVTAIAEIRGITGGTLLSAALPADVVTVATIEALAAILQTALDSTSAYVVFSGPPTATGSLTITSVEGGVDVYLYVDSESLTDGFRWLGFYGPTGQEWAEVASTGAPAYLTKHLTVAADSGFGLYVTTDLQRFIVSTFQATLGVVVGVFTDGETVTQAVSGATATSHVVGMVCYFTDVAGTFVDFEMITGALSGATATLLVISTPLFSDAELVTGATSGKSGTVALFSTNLDISAGAGFANDDVITGPSGSARVRMEGLDYLTLYDLVGTFAFGDAVTGAPSGAAGTVEEVRQVMVIQSATGAFTPGEQISGGTSTTIGYLWQLDNPYTFSKNIEVTSGTSLTFDEIGADMQTLITSALTEYLIDSPVVTVVFDSSSGPWAYTITLAGQGLVEFSISGGSSFEALATSLVTKLFGGNIAANGTLVDIGAEPLDFYLSNLTATVVLDTDTYTVVTALSYSDATSFDDAIDTAGTGDFDALAIALNAFTTAFNDGTERRLWFIGGTELSVRSVVGSSLASLTLDATPGAGYDYLGFPNPVTDVGANGTGIAIGQGTTTPGSTVTDVYEPPEATLFSVSVGSTELLFCASGDADPYQIFPGQTADGEVGTTLLPRDISVSSDYSGAIAATVKFTDTSFESPVAIGITKGSDYLYLYEQRTQLDFTVGLYESDLNTDRLPGVMTSAGSAVVKLPALLSPEFTFLQSSTLESEDVVQVGDILFIEEGDDTGGYLITARTSATELTLDRALSTSSGIVYRYGNDGVITAGTATLSSGASGFSSSDIGRYLTVWASNRTDFDGSYNITAVDVSDPSNTILTLDTDTFASDEVDLHWAVVKAPTEAPAASSTGGRTALVGLRPFRVYKGTPTQWLVVSVGTTLDRATAEVVVAYGDSSSPPKKGIKQPYQFVRPGVQRIASTAMAANIDNGLYYFDVLTKSLGGDELYNIPEDTRMEAVFGTFDSSGYYYSVVDNRFTFSPYESLNLVFTPFFLPKGNDDTQDALIGIESRGIRLTYELAPLVDQVQRFMVSEDDRILCANPLVRHFLPSYVYLTIQYTGGNSSATIATGLSDSIEVMQPTDALDVSVLERVLNNNGVKAYEHPIELVTVTHDLDRRLVAMRSDNRIGEDVVDFNGTNRTTFFIPGPDASAASSDSDIADGERIRLIRKVAKTSVR